MIEQTTTMLMPIAAWIFFASLKSIAVIPLVLLIRRICARWLTPQGRYGLWFAAIAGLAIPFGAHVDIHNESRATAASMHAQVAPAPSVANHEQPVITTGDATEEGAAIPSPQKTGVLIWLLGVAGLSAIVLYNATRYARICSTASELDRPTDELFQSCKQALGIRRHVRLLETSGVESPVLVGYWRPTLLLPRKLSAQVNNGQVRLVLLHELTHIRRHDILVNWLITFVQVAHWFNPLVWCALRIARHDMEHACDASVLCQLTVPERMEYGDTLIRLSDITPQRALLVQNARVVESRSQLKARISMISQFKPRGTISSMLGVALVTLTSAIAVTQAADAPQEAAKPQPQAAAEQKSPALQKETPTQAGAGTGTRTQAFKPPAITTKRKAVDASASAAAYFQIKYPMAKDIASFIQSAPGVGLLSDTGSIAVDERTNTLLVNDTASNVAAIRQLIARLDAPVQQILLEAEFVLLDEDLIQELQAGTSRNGNVSPAIIYLAADKSVADILEAAQRAHRAEVISEPRWVMANRRMTSIEQSVGLPPRPDAAPDAPPRKMHLKLGITPAVRSDMSTALDVDATIDLISNVVIVAGGASVPSIDSREIKSLLMLDSGATAMLDFTGQSGLDSAQSAAGSEHKRRLVVFMSLKRLAANPLPPR